MNVILCDDHRMFSEAVSGLLRQYRHTILAAPTSPADALAIAQTVVPDVYIVDLHFGLEVETDLVEAIHALAPAVPMLVLTADSDSRLLREVLRKGADGVALKMDGIEEINQMLYRLTDPSFRQRRSAVAPAKLWSQLASTMARRQARLRSSHVLTDREQQAMVLLARGESTASAARSMGVSVPTIRTHLHHLYIKLNVHSRVELVAYAIREGIVYVDDLADTRTSATNGAMAS
jgi:two-component system nitrate/nitrite response regulator NarL